MPRRKKMKSSKQTPADGTPPPSSTPRDRPPSNSPRNQLTLSAPMDQLPSDEGARRQPSGKERVKKEKKHKDRKAGRELAGPVPAPPISQKVEGAPPISQKVEGAPPISQKVERAPPISQKVEGAPPISQKVEGAPPISQQIHSNPKKSSKAGKASARDQELSKKRKKVKTYSTNRTAGPESASHPPSGTSRPPLIVKPFQEAKPVALASVDPHRQHQSGEGGSKLRPGRLSLGEESSDEKGTQQTQVGVSSA